MNRKKLTFALLLLSSMLAFHSCEKLHLTMDEDLVDYEFHLRNNSEQDVYALVHLSYVESIITQDKVRIVDTISRFAYFLNEPIQPGEVADASTYVAGAEKLTFRQSFRGGGIKMKTLDIIVFKTKEDMIRYENGMETVIDTIYRFTEENTPDSHELTVNYP